jgi:hypothetical protein
VVNSKLLYEIFFNKKDKVYVSLSHGLVLIMNQSIAYTVYKYESNLQNIGYTIVATTRYLAFMYSECHVQKTCKHNIKSTKNSFLPSFVILSNREVNYLRYKYCIVIMSSGEKKRYSKEDEGQSAQDPSSPIVKDDGGSSSDSSVNRKDSKTKHRDDDRRKKKRRKSDEDERKHKKKRNRDDYSSSESSDSYSSESSMGDKDDDDSSSPSSSYRHRKKRKRSKHDYDDDDDNDRKKKKRKKDKKKKHSRKEKKSNKKKKKSKSEKDEDKDDGRPVWGKYGIIKLSDLPHKQRSFNVWLEEVKKIPGFNGPKYELHNLFKEYAEDYNTATLPHIKYYDYEKWELEEYNKTKAAAASSSSHGKEAAFFLEQQEAAKKKRERDQMLVRSLMSKEKIEEMKRKQEVQAEMAHAFKTGNQQRYLQLKARLEPEK